MVRGSLKLTQRQSELLNELGIPIEGVELDLSQSDLAGMSNSIKQLMEGQQAHSVECSGTFSTVLMRR